MEAGAKVRTYKIGQAAKLLDVKPFVLRFWETEFKDVLVPVRTPSGQRAYTEGNVALVREIKRLLYDEGLTIEGAKKRLAQPRKSTPASAPALRPEPLSPKPDLLTSADSEGITDGKSGNQSGGHSGDQPRNQPGNQPAAQAASQALAQHAARSEALCATLTEVAHELRAIRDLLG